MDHKFLSFAEKRGALLVCFSGEKLQWRQVLLLNHIIRSLGALESLNSPFNATLSKPSPSIHYFATYSDTMIFLVNCVPRAS